MLSSLKQDFPGGSDDKESTCNAGDPGLIPGLGRFPGEGNGYPLHYSYLENSMDRGSWRAIVHRVPKSQTWLSNSTFIWPSFVAQLVKNPLAMWETWVSSLGWESPWRRERLPTPVFWTREFHGLYRSWGHRVRHDWATFTHSLTKILSNYNYSFYGDVLERVTPQSYTFKLVNLGKRTELYSIGWKCQYYALLITVAL